MEHFSFSRDLLRFFLFRGNGAQEMRGRLTRLYGRSDILKVLPYWKDTLVTGESNILDFLIKWLNVDICIRVDIQAREITSTTLVVEYFQQVKKDSRS